VLKNVLQKNFSKTPSIYNVLLAMKNVKLVLEKIIFNVNHALKGTFFLKPDANKPALKISLLIQILFYVNLVWNRALCALLNKTFV
jgi:hypothetical protein